jgi:hypothetical protein
MPIRQGFIDALKTKISHRDTEARRKDEEEKVETGNGERRKGKPGRLPVFFSL